jgi:predicted cupin superfamily sugar epimerase
LENVDYLIEQFELEPHPEGGYFRRIYESEVVISEDELPERYRGSRRTRSTILYLLTEDDVSKLHSLKSDETWHFYSGSALTLHHFHPDGQYRSVLLGANYRAGHRPNYTIPAGHTFGATVESGYAFLGCTVSPEFRFDDFELSDPEELKTDFSNHTALIERLS